MIKRFLIALLLATPFLGPAGAQASTGQQVVLAGGCFWGMQAVFESLRGVTAVTAGYAGGSAALAHYELVSTGTTGNAESVRIDYDPRQISFEQLLRVYFLVAHDPTQLNRQGPDEGTQYRSEIFYENASQQRAAERAIAQLNSSHRFSSPVVTKVVALSGFYPAESYHQDYLVHNPGEPYIVENDLPKLRALRSTFPHLVRPNAPPMLALHS